MPRVAKTIGFSVPPEVIEDVERIANAEGRTRSELFREMVRVYKRDRELVAFEDLSAYGRERARVRAVRTEDDVERLIHEARGV
ncbi:MAG: ribbon-helix-helix protein, CopG family [Coriobacteriia bacterium]|jgi:metal-responsive CopG/Arc/MetJ family transcriptional regulator